MRRSAGLDEGLAEIRFSARSPQILGQSLEQLEENKTPTAPVLKTLRSA